jgi:hypothetical protein
VPIVLKSGILNLLEPSGPVKACNGIALHLKLNAERLNTALKLTVNISSVATDLKGPNPSLEAEPPK